LHLNGKVFPIQLPSIPHMVQWLLLVDSGLCCKCDWCTLLACDSHMDTFILLEIWILAFLHLKPGCNICPFFVYNKTCITAYPPNTLNNLFWMKIGKNLLDRLSKNRCGSIFLLNMLATNKCSWLVTYID
jgi:hypothetical protein